MKDLQHARHAEANVFLLGLTQSAAYSLQQHPSYWAGTEGSQSTGQEDGASYSASTPHTLLYVTAAVGCVPAAFMNKRYGRHMGILLGAALLGIPSLVVAFTPGMTQMIVIRSVMGIGKFANS